MRRLRMRSTTVARFAVSAHQPEPRDGRDDCAAHFPVQEPPAREFAAAQPLDELPRRDRPRVNAPDGYLGFGYAWLFGLALVRRRLRR